MRNGWLGFLGCLIVMTATARAADKLPSNQWYQGVRGLREAQAFQKQTNADLVVYFARYNTSDEKGLCHWLEKRGLFQPDVARVLRDYIKVQIVTPVSSKDEKDIAGFKFNACPAVFIVKPDGTMSRCQTFDWTSKKPELFSPDALIELFRSKSSPRYQKK